MGAEIVAECDVPDDLRRTVGVKMKLDQAAPVSGSDLVQ